MPNERAAAKHAARSLVKSSVLMIFELSPSVKGHCLVTLTNLETLRRLVHNSESRDTPVFTTLFLTLGPFAEYSIGIPSGAVVNHINILCWSF
jgi:hypothetical protein